MRFEEVQLTGFSSNATILIATVIITALTLFILALCYYSARYTIILAMEKFVYKNDPKNYGLLYKYHVIQRFAYLIPAVFLYNYPNIFDIKAKYAVLYFGQAVEAIALIYIIYNMALIISALLSYALDKYEHLEVAKSRPIKSYLQVIKIFLFIFATVMAFSTLFEKSPMYLFAGIGTLTAILALIFRDSILGFIASIQLSAYNMVHIGDAIEMPNYGADGEVVDISLNTVKVQNADKSIVTIPSYALLTSGMKNWRGMQEAGGRRVKRSIFIDITSIKICSQELIDRLSKLSLLKKILRKKIQEYKKYNEKHHIDAEDYVDGKRLNNISVFRYYLEAYLAQHPDVHQGMRRTIRQLQATATGLPIEIYFFTNDINEDHYESIQAEIMDHIYSVIPAFELHAFQYISAHAENQVLNQPTNQITKITAQ